MNDNSRVSTQSIAQEMLETLKSNGYQWFTARPRNFYKPEETLWWLVPSTDWPSYKYGKLVLFRSQDNYKTGIHIEKGISNFAGQMLSLQNAQKLCINNDWIWHDFLSDLFDGNFEKRLNEISTVLNKSLRIVIQASNGINVDESVAEIIEGFETNNIISFDYKVGALTCIQNEVKGEMKKYGHISSLADFASIFDDKEMDWFWIDLYILIEVDSESHRKIKDYALSFVENYGKLFGH